jgi:hypothetical protein
MLHLHGCHCSGHGSTSPGSSSTHHDRVDFKVRLDGGEYRRVDKRDQEPFIYVKRLLSEVLECTSLFIIVATYVYSTRRQSKQQARSYPSLLPPFDV